MIELYEIRQFVAFADAGTLSEAAETLHLSQPALSRNMKKLEDDLGITLFQRSKNKLTLNENGEYVLGLARKLLEDADSLAARARDFDRRNRTISLGVCAPAPAWKLTPFISNLFPHMTLQSEINDDESHLLSDLDNGIHQLVITHRKPEGDSYYYKECATESLMFALQQDHRYAGRDSLSFADMDGENMLLMADIGFWGFVRDKMPSTRFLEQSDRYSFNELLQASTLASFTTDLAEKYSDVPSGRVNIPISDKEASVSYYLVCKIGTHKQFGALFSAI